MNLEQIRILLEKMIGQKISNKELATALDMPIPSISRKLTTKTKLKQRQIQALEEFYNVELPQVLCDTEVKYQHDFDLLEKIIIAVEDFFSKKYSANSAQKARIIISLYSMGLVGKVEICDVVIENLFRLMNK